MSVRTTAVQHLDTRGGARRGRAVLRPRVLTALVVVAALGAALPTPRSDAQDARFQLRFDFDGPNETRAFLDCVPRGTTDFRQLRHGVPTSELRNLNDCVAEIQREQGIETIVRQRVRRGNLVRNQWTFRSFLTRQQVQKLKAFDIATSLWNRGVRPMVSMPAEPAPPSMQSVTLDPVVVIDEPDFYYFTGSNGIPIILRREDYSPQAWTDLVTSDPFFDLDFSFPPADGRVDVSGTINDSTRAYAPMTSEEVDGVRAFLNGPYGTFVDGQFVYPLFIDGTFDPVTGRRIKLELTGTITFAIDRNPPDDLGEVPVQIIGLSLSGTSSAGDVVISGGPHLEGPTITAIRRRGRTRTVEGPILEGTLQIGADSGEFAFASGFRIVIPWRRLKRFTGIRVRGTDDVVIGGLGGPGDIDGPPGGAGISGRLRLRRVRFGRHARARFDLPGPEGN